MVIVVYKVLVILSNTISRVLHHHAAPVSSVAGGRAGAGAGVGGDAG